MADGHVYGSWAYAYLLEARPPYTEWAAGRCCNPTACIDHRQIIRERASRWRDVQGVTMKIL